METLAYPSRKWRQAWLMVLAILVTLFAVLACLAAPAFPQHMWLVRIGGGLAIVLFGAAMVFFAGPSRSRGSWSSKCAIRDNSSIAATR